MENLKLEKVENTKKKRFDHSNNEYYKLTLENNQILLFTAFELNKALARYKKWSKKENVIN